MKGIFLRGKIPPSSEHPEKLLYDDIHSCEDMWTQFFYYLLLQLDGEGELIYEGGNNRLFTVNNFSEHWVPSINRYNPSFSPDFIFCRGGFAYYDLFLKKFPSAKKIYYGAGKRFYPQSSFKDYDLFLVDSEKQLEKIKTKTNKKVMLFIKPAATLFRPINVEKKYDICFMANATQGNLKRHELFLKSFANTNLKILNLGNTNKRYIHLAQRWNVDIEWGGWSLRRYLPPKISSCKIGVVCSTDYDSCPRVVPEYLACGLPVIATENIHFWQDKYITNTTGLLSNEQTILDNSLRLLETYERYQAVD